MQDRQVALQRRLAEVLVHRVEAGRASRRTPRVRSRAWSRGRSPSPSSSGRRPSPRSRTCCRCRCRTPRRPRRWSRRRRSAWRPPPRPAEPGQRPIPRGVGVGHRLQRREGLRGDDEQRLRRIEVAGRLGEVGAVDVGDEAEGHVAAAVVAQRLVGHHRAEVGAADADVDDVADRLAGVALPLARADPLGERAPSGRAPRGPRWTTSSPSTISERSARHPQRDVQDGAVLGDVDLLAREHRLAPLRQAALPRRAGPAAASVSSLIRFLE